jgi:hypothetical protein
MKHMSRNLCLVSMDSGPGRNGAAGEECRRNEELNENHAHVDRHSIECLLLTLCTPKDSHLEF